MPWPQTGATHYHAQLGLPDKGRAIKGLVVCNSWDLEPQDLTKILYLSYKFYGRLGIIHEIYGFMLSFNVVGKSITRSLGKDLTFSKSLKALKFKWISEW